MTKILNDNPKEDKESPLHPFIKGMQEMATSMGRDIGIMALRSIEAQRGGGSAVLYWDEPHLPNVLHVFLVPPGQLIPPLAPSILEHPILQRQSVNKETLVIVLKKPEPVDPAQDNDGQQPGRA